MWRFLQRAFPILALAGVVNSASAFALLGRYDSWQVSRIGYNLPISDVAIGLLPDIGGPMNLGEEYRWNISPITYGFDESFLNYFGSKGTAAVTQAVAILNNLPAMSQMSSNLSEFPTDTRRVNYQASALGLTDLKTVALSYLLEELGLASPERYVFTLRARTEINNVVYYTVINRNFDPVTSNPSKYVNDVLYTYYIGEFPAPPVDFADAVEVQVDPLAFGFTAVVSLADGLWKSGIIGQGQFFTGLTRDDAGSLRYLYGGAGRWQNLNVENLLPGTTGSVQNSGDCPWCVVGGTNAVTTNVVVDLALRPGVDKLSFQQGRYDSMFGQFITVTNQYVDHYVTNYSLKTQNTQRVLTQPDILFAAADLGVDAGGNPIYMSRTDTSTWANNDALNGQTTLAGPGVIQPEVAIIFSKLGPYYYNVGPPFNYLDEGTGIPGFVVWGSFDGTTNAPVVYPDGVSIQDLEQQVLGGN